ncbi:Adenylate kinase, partial [Giardia duodenalis]
VQTAVATPLIVYALVMLVGMPVPAERASRVPMDTLHALLHTSQPSSPSPVHPIDGPPPLMRAQPLAGMYSRDGPAPQQLYLLRRGQQVRCTVCSAGGR